MYYLLSPVQDKHYQVGDCLSAMCNHSKWSQMLDLTKRAILSLFFHHIFRVNLENQLRKIYRIVFSVKEVTRTPGLKIFSHVFNLLTPNVFKFLYINILAVLHSYINPYGKICFLLCTELSCFVCKPESSTFNQQWNANNSCRSNGMQSTPVLAIPSFLLYSSY